MSDRVEEITALVAEGYTSAMIAVLLGLTLRQVEYTREKHHIRSGIRRGNNHLAIRGVSRERTAASRTVVGPLIEPVRPAVPVTSVPSRFDRVDTEEL